MIRSLAVIMLPLLLITLLFTHNVGHPPVIVLDWRPVVAKARAQSPYPVLAPTDLPADWRATQANWVRTGEPFLNGEPAVRNIWQLGFLAPDGTFIGLDQGDGKPEEFVKDQSQSGLSDGTSVVGGKTWQRLASENNRTRSLVLSSPAVTTLVVGDTSYAALESYAATLRAR